jgi:hypothetical protein
VQPGWFCVFFSSGSAKICFMYIKDAARIWICKNTLLLIINMKGYYKHLLSSRSLLQNKRTTGINCFRLSQAKSSLWAQITSHPLKKIYNSCKMWTGNQQACKTLSLFLLPLNQAEKLHLMLQEIKFMSTFRKTWAYWRF